MKILITGIAGFLGSHLANRMIELGHTVIGVDNLIGGYIDNVPNKATFYPVDCADLHTMVRYMDGCDLVYHAACTAYEGLSVFSPNLVYQNTAQITASVISAAIQNKVTRFVYCSSMARYGKQGVPFTEDMSCMPEDPYGIAKYSGELLLKNLADTHGMDYSIAIPHNIIGPAQKYDDPYRNVVGIMINLMMQDRQPYIYGDGKQTRCFSFISDDIYCLEKLAFKSNIIGEAVNIGPDSEFVTINELAEIIADLLNFKLDPIYVSERPKEVKLAYCSADKARKLLDYKKEVSLRNGIKSMIDYIDEKGTKPFQYHLDLEIKNNCPKTWKDRLI